MQAGPQYTPPQQPAGPGGGRGGAILVGGIAFAIVFLLIVAVTIGFLVLRSSGDGSVAPVTSSTASSPPPPEPSGEITSSAGPSAAEEPAGPEERCWTPERERSSSNPSGRLRGGGLEFIPTSGFDSRSELTWGAFLTDGQVAYTGVEGSWISNLAVGAVEWQPGFEYPGDEVAAERILDCMYADGAMWGDTSDRSLNDQVTDPVTVSGMPGYRTTAVLAFGQHSFDSFDSVRITVVVVNTPEGPSFFISEFPVGYEDHEEAATAAYDSLTGLSG